MPRGRKRSTKDPHLRFAEWLEGSTASDPPRDIAVHAAVCPGCQQRIAAIDMLTAVDTARAGIPQVRPLPAPSMFRIPNRALVAVGGLVALLVVGFGSWRLAANSPISFEPPIDTPTQAVLGNTGIPSATPSVTVEEESVQPTSEDPNPTARPSGAAPTVSLPPYFPPPPTFGPPLPTFGPPLPTAHPTARPTARPTATPRPTPLPTPLPTQVPTQVPTEQPTPVPDDCADGIDNDGDFLIDALDPGCLLDGNEPSA